MSGAYWEEVWPQDWLLAGAGGGDWQYLRVWPSLGRGAVTLGSPRGTWLGALAFNGSQFEGSEEGSPQFSSGPPVPRTQVLPAVGGSRLRVLSRHREAVFPACPAPGILAPGVGASWAQGLSFGGAAEGCIRLYPSARQQWLRGLHLRSQSWRPRGGWLLGDTPWGARFPSCTQNRCPRLPRTSPCVGAGGECSTASQLGILDTDGASMATTPCCWENKLPPPKKKKKNRKTHSAELPGRPAKHLPTSGHSTDRRGRGL